MTRSGALPLFTQLSMSPSQSIWLGPGPPWQCKTPGARNMRVLAFAGAPVAAFMRSL